MIIDYYSIDHVILQFLSWNSIHLHMICTVQCNNDRFHESYLNYVRAFLNESTPWLGVHGTMTSGIFVWEIEN